MTRIRLAPHGNEGLVWMAGGRDSRGLGRVLGSGG